MCEIFSKKIQIGDKYTIEGCGKSARGHTVINGRSIKTGRKMKVKTLTEFTVDGFCTAKEALHDHH